MQMPKKKKKGVLGDIKVLELITLRDWNLVRKGKEGYFPFHFINSFIKEFFFHNEHITLVVRNYVRWSGLNSRPI